MAPEFDPAPITSTASLDAPAPLAQTSEPSSSSTDIEQPAASTHGFGYLGQEVKLPQRKKRRATFQVGSPGLSGDEAESSTSGRSSSASSDSPAFDVRASFAPMPVYGKAKGASAQPSTYRSVSDTTFMERSGHDASRSAASAIMDSSSSEDDADGLSFGGRRWKGKTVHAVELELEALRDERLMSHAPDAAYLASRLEGVRRNLEIEERRPNYVPYEEDMLSDEAEPALAPDASEVVRQLYPFQHTVSTTANATTLPHRPVSNASSVSLTEGETPHDLDFGLQFDASASSYAAPLDNVEVHDPNEVSMPLIPNSLVPSHAKQIDPAARAAALDARIEVRPLRRGDLEQVRDLHAFHGDSDRVSIPLTSLELASCPQSSPIETTTQSSPSTALPHHLSHGNLTEGQAHDRCCDQTARASSCRSSPTLLLPLPPFGGFASTMI